LGPRNVRIRAQFADLLALQGRFDEALIEARIGESLDPLSPRARHEVASVLRYARRFDEAIAQALRTLEIDPNFGPAHLRSVTPTWRWGGMIWPSTHSAAP
jgi:tetratricopeptide (TPR) repeat protein